MNSINSDHHCLWHGDSEFPWQDDPSVVKRRCNVNLNLPCWLQWDIVLASLGPECSQNYLIQDSSTDETRNHRWGQHRPQVCHKIHISGRLNTQNEMRHLVSVQTIIGVSSFSGFSFHPVFSFVWFWNKTKVPMQKTGGHWETVRTCAHFQKLWRVEIMTITDFFTFRFALSFSGPFFVKLRGWFICGTNIKFCCAAF